jgi:hypothetical protein
MAATLRKQNLIGHVRDSDGAGETHQYGRLTSPPPKSRNAYEKRDPGM